MATKKYHYELNEQELIEEEAAKIPTHEPVGGRKGGRGVAGKDLSDTKSSDRKGRKSSTSGKKLEQEGK